MRVLTFLSDFGRGSPYPAAMKGAAASVCGLRDRRASDAGGPGAPDVTDGGVTFVDITHDVPPQDVRGGAYLLRAAAPAFPAGTVHCAVVDPGVGTDRAALAIVSGGQQFVGPDNGLLLPAAKRLGTPQVYRLDKPEFWRQPVSPTFHGRDVFAPVAAFLVSGTPIEALGTPAPAWVDLAFAEGRRAGRGLEGEILWVDAFGNLITTIPGDLLDALRTSGASGSATVDLGGVVVAAVVGRTFGDVPAGEVVVYAGSDGLVEIAVRERPARPRQGSSRRRPGGAAGRFGVGPGVPLRIDPV